MPDSTENVAPVEAPAVETKSAPPVDESTVKPEEVSTTEDVVKDADVAKPDEVEGKLEVETGKPEDKEGEEEEVKLTYGDQELSMDDLDIPDDLRDGLKEKGFEVDDLVKELYSGEFGISDETKQALYDVYGKYVVDATLKSIDTQNSSFSKDLAERQAGEVKAAETAWAETLEIVGTEGAWEDLNHWAAETLSDTALEELNDVMENGSWTAQKLIIKGLHSEKESGVVADKSLELTDLDNASKSSDGTGALSYSEYNQLLSSGAYSAMTPAEQSAVDDRRRAGIQGSI